MDQTFSLVNISPQVGASRARGEDFTGIQG